MAKGRNGSGRDRATKEKPSRERPQKEKSTKGSSERASAKGERAERGMKFTSDKQLYEKGRFRDIPTKDLEKLMHKDTNYDRVGRAALHLKERQAKENARARRQSKGQGRSGKSSGRRRDDR